MKVRVRARVKPRRGIINRRPGKGQVHNPDVYAKQEKMEE